MCFVCVYYVTSNDTCCVHRYNSYQISPKSIPHIVKILKIKKFYWLVFKIKRQYMSAMLKSIQEQVKKTLAVKLNFKINSWTSSSMNYNNTRWKILLNITWWIIISTLFSMFKLVLVYLYGFCVYTTYVYENNYLA